MESHQVHSHAKEKHFKHYFFEFLMLFLAVTLGFFVENYREHFVENNREKDYIISIAQDIIQDINQLDTIILRRNIKYRQMDSLLYLLNYSNPDEYGDDIYYYSRWMPRTYRFIPTDRTLLQLNSGNWRLIRNSKASDALLTYNNLVRSITTYIEQREESIVQLIYPSLHKLFDNRVFEKMINGMSFTRPVGNPKLLSKDKMVINEFCNQIHFLKNADLYFIVTITSLRYNAIKTLNILKNEYKLKEK